MTGQGWPVSKILKPQAHLTDDEQLALWRIVPNQPPALLIWIDLSMGG